MFRCNQSLSSPPLSEMWSLSPIHVSEMHLVHNQLQDREYVDLLWTILCGLNCPLTQEEWIFKPKYCTRNTYSFSNPSSSSCAMDALDCHIFTDRLFFWNTGNCTVFFGWICSPNAGLLLFFLRK